MSEALDCGNDYVTANNVAKAWVNYNQSTPAINDSFNVDSVTDDAAGEWTINYTRNMGNANYAVLANTTQTQAAGAWAGIDIETSTVATGSVSMITWTGSSAANRTLGDRAENFVAVLGDE